RRGERERNEIPRTGAALRDVLHDRSSGWEGSELGVITPEPPRGCKLPRDQRSRSVSSAAAPGSSARVTPCAGFGGGAKSCTAPSNDSVSRLTGASRASCTR